MATIIPFNCIRPAGDRASEIAALPYDVFDRQEAKEEVKDKPLSFLRIDRAEVNFPDDFDMYNPAVYEKASDIFWDMFSKGHFVKDEGPYYYIYELTMNRHVQTGIVALASLDDYENGVIKRHEKTLAAKEEDRVRHIDTVNAQTGPIFLAYRPDEVIRSITNRVKEGEDLFDFTSDDGVRHRGFIIHEKSDIETIQRAFEAIQSIYIADGHHRAASAVRVGRARREDHPDYTGNEEFNYFMSVLFPSDELLIMDYNRVIDNYNFHTPANIIKLIEKVAFVTPVAYPVHPEFKGAFSLYIEGRWYSCAFHEDIIEEAEETNDPVRTMDVSLLQDNVLQPIFDIKDPKRDDRIDFVGGIRGLEELERRVNTDMKVAFAMYPTSMEEVMQVSDAGMLMPPKSTWFEPKLRSGLFIHELDG